MVGSQELKSRIWGQIKSCVKRILDQSSKVRKPTNSQSYMYMNLAVSTRNSPKPLVHNRLCPVAYYAQFPEAAATCDAGSVLFGVLHWTVHSHSTAWYTALQRLLQNGASIRMRLEAIHCDSGVPRECCCHEVCTVYLAVRSVWPMRLMSTSRERRLLCWGTPHVPWLRTQGALNWESLESAAIQIWRTQLARPRDHWRH